jgi:hypothetical protein
MKSAALLFLLVITLNANAAGTLESYQKKLAPVYADVEKDYWEGAGQELERKHGIFISAAIEVVKQKNHPKAIRDKAESALDVWISYELETNKNAALSRAEKKPNFDYEMQLLKRLTSLTAAVKVYSHAQFQLGQPLDQDLTTLSNELEFAVIEGRKRADAVLKIKSESEYLRLDPERDLKAAMKPLQKPAPEMSWPKGSNSDQMSADDCALYTRLQIDMPGCPGTAAR